MSGPKALTLRPRKTRDDYRILGNSGRRVIKETNILNKIESSCPNSTMSLNMALQKLIDDENRICLKIDRYFEEFTFDLMFDIEDIEKGILEFREHIENYEELHVALKRELEDDYRTDYPNFDATYQRLTGWVKEAKVEIKRRKVEICKMEDSKEVSRLREVRHAQEEKARAEEVEASRIAEVSRLEEERKVNALRDQVNTEQKYFTERMYDEIRNITETGSTLADDLESHLSIVRNLKTAHSELFIRVETAFGAEFNAQFGSEFKSQRDHLNNVIRSIMEEITRKKLRN